MRSQQAMEAYVAELNKEIEGLSKAIPFVEREAAIFISEQINQRCLVREAVKWCLDETLYPYTKTK